MKKRLFIIENEFDAMQACFCVLQESYELIVADDARSAISKFKHMLKSNERIDLMLIDLMMPTHGISELQRGADNWNGAITGYILYEMFRHLYAQHAEAVPPAIFVTALNDVQFLAKISKETNLSVLQKRDVHDFRIIKKAVDKVLVPDKPAT